MALKTLGVSTSPCLNGNTDLRLRRALCGAEGAGCVSANNKVGGLPKPSTLRFFIAPSRKV